MCSSFPENDRNEKGPQVFTWSPRRGRRRLGIYPGRSSELRAPRAMPQSTAITVDDMHLLRLASFIGRSYSRNSLYACAIAEGKHRLLATTKKCDRGHTIIARGTSPARAHTS